jgi:SAM-dependent methyltransferase
MTAVDHSPLMIEQVWPGDDEKRRAILGDWTDLPFEAESFSAVIGDGSLTPAGEGVDDTLAEVRRVLAPGGAAVFRLFCQADERESLEEIRRDVEAGWQGNIHALKWRIAMAVVAERPRPLAPAKDVLVAFNHLFPDRQRLAKRTGWTLEEIGTLDAFETATHHVCFLTLPQMLERGSRFFRSARVIPASGYPLAERCPTVVWTN